ncbi:hypothetical protein NJB1728e22_31650 [Mycobacterium marinum]|nr:hypothetical protein [Mycobacterium marinum]GJO85031.1 hypothetical protein NJB1907E49_34900 [Mycobacterium marinum]GJP11116.1 hypothetical protein NJB1728e22_31650 [Mycobacterium marinum]
MVQALWGSFARVLGQEESTTTWHRWLAQYGGMEANDAKRLKDLEAENAAALGMAKGGQIGPQLGLAGQRRAHPPALARRLMPTSRRAAAGVQPRASSFKNC